jgi:hypothetical protein
VVSCIFLSLCFTNGVDSGKSNKFIEGYKRKEVVWDPKQPLHFHKIKKQDACDELVKDINSHS